MKTILAYETSETIKSFFTENVDKNEYTITFAETFSSLMNCFLKDKFDAILVNADLKNPDSFSVVNLLKSYEKVNHMVVALYTAEPSRTLEYAGFKCAADKSFFLDLEKDAAKNAAAEAKEKDNSEETAAEGNAEEVKADAENSGKAGAEEQSISCLQQKLASIFETEAAEDKKENCVNSENQSMKTALVHSLLALTKKWESCQEICQDFLNIVSYYCQVPMCSVFLKQTESINYYVLAGESIAEKDKEEFQKVAYSDFQDSLKNEAAKKYYIWQVEAEQKNSSNVYENNLPLSAYRFEKIYDSENNVIATLHVTAQGNLSQEQIDLIGFCVKKVGFILESSLKLEKKMFFEKRIRKAFSRFVPEQIIDELVASSDKSDKIAVGEKREVAVLFSDIRSFTNISERNKPEVIVAFLNRYFSIMCDIIKKYGGTVDKFIGDAIMALFGAPVSYEDNARRAVAAAYEMREALANVPLEDLVMPEGMKFDIGIGINYGDLIVGSIGSKDKTDYSVIGDNVNLASRLEGLTKTYGSKIIVSQSVKNDIQDQTEFAFRYLDDVKVKGKAVAVPIYAVDRSEEEYSAQFKTAYFKGMELYKQGLFAMAKDYFDKALLQVPEDKATKLMLSRCDEFIANPPEHWDGGFEFHTK